jgi:two-component system, LuxR family, response regulator FixJ
VPDLGDPLIFLIDDDDIVRDSLKVLIESHGMCVQDFRSATEFLAGADPERGDCLVLGFNRLIMDGLELVSTLRRRGARLPVIFTVGGGDAAKKSAVLASGASAYLERPVEESALIRAIKTALNRPSSHRANSSSELLSAPSAPLPARS